MTYRVDARVQGVQTGRLDSALNPPSPKPQIKHLPPRNHAPLPLSQLRNRSLLARPLQSTTMGH
jgi:hypothetical protein